MAVQSQDMAKSECKISNLLEPGSSEDLDGVAVCLLNDMSKPFPSHLMGWRVIHKGAEKQANLQGSTKCSRQWPLT